MEKLHATVEQAVREYAGEGLNGFSYFAKSDDEKLMAVLAVAKVRDQHVADASLIVRLDSGYVVIEQDKTNKPLVEALLQLGIPRERIVLAYAGESLEAA
jgi:hypothetical protein